MSAGLSTVLKRGSEVAPVIIKAFNEKGLPPQIGIYLAMIDSEFCPCLSSGTGAKGMFQFTGTYARRYGVKDVSQPSTDTRPDDRCKVDIMAPVAAQYMKELVTMFGTGPDSVPLAIASNNAGGGVLSANLIKAMDAARNSGNPERSFWTMVANADQMTDQFQRENINYVPKFFAAAIVGENPQVFGVDTSPLSTYTIEQTNSANGSTADTSNAANAGATELSTVQKYAANVLSSISKDTTPVLTEQSLTAINAQVQQYQNSSSFSEELRVIRQALPQISAAAKRSSIRTALAVYATMARIHKDGGRGDPAQVAQQICPQLAKMRVIFGDELANDSLLSVAALEEGPGLQMRITRLVRRVNDSPLTIRSIWYLHDHQVISEQTYDFVLKFIALGVISQDPQRFGITAEPLMF
jgi:hypothetical protein